VEAAVDSKTGDPVSSQLPVFRFDSLDRTRVVHGVTTRTPSLPLNGNMSYMVGDSPDLVRQNRAAWAAAIGYDPGRLVLGRQVHETAVVSVDERHAGLGADSVESSIRRVDGLMTRTPNLPIGVMAADCVPILLFDPVAGAVAAVHAGWRGTVEGIVGRSIDVMAEAYASSALNLKAFLGPAICHNCYQVGGEVIERWEDHECSRHGQAVTETTDGFYFDLREANRLQLRHAGVPEEAIEVSEICTKCANGQMFSRRGLGPRTGLFTSVIMLRDSDDSWSEIE
jgi:polyphenol oxidase